MKNKFNTIQFKKPQKKGFISVIIPVYKDAAGLKDTLDSLQKQTLSHDKYEIIVANDGGSKEISGLCKKYQNVSEVLITPNKGSYNARNRALEESQGEFLAFTDADMTFMNDYLAKAYPLFTDFDYFGGKVNIINTKNIFDLYEKCTAFPMEMHFKDMKFLPTASVFTKRKIIDTFGAFDNRLFSGGDREFGERVFDKCKTTFNKQIIALHPVRGFKNTLKRQKRIAEGGIMLSKLYPDRFGKLNNSSKLIRVILNMLFIPKIECDIPGNSRLKTMQIKTIAWFIAVYCNICKYYYSLRLK